MKRLLFTLLLALSSSLFSLVNAQCHDCQNGKNPNWTSRVHPVTTDSLPMAFIAQNVCGLNYTSATVLTETRTGSISCPVGTQFPTTISLTGLPSVVCANIVKAYVYLGVSYTEATPPPAFITITNPNSTVTTDTLSMRGAGLPVCWAETGTATYRADITSLITGNGNYGIDVSGFANKNWEVDGVTLFVIYSNPSASYSGSIVLYDGDICFTAGLINAKQDGFSVCSTPSNATAFAMLGDMQCDVNGGNNTETFNGVTQSFTNQFWNFCSIPVNLTSGQDSMYYQTYTNDVGDCYFLGVDGLYWQNTNCVTCIPLSTTMTLTPNSIAATCGNNGVAMVAVAGQTGPLTYTWTPGGQTNAVATGLAPGTYTVNVSDGSTCATDSVTITNTGMVITTSSTNATCSSNGSATVNVTGGVSPYTYLWNNSATTASISVSAGTYSVTITDNNGCNLTASVLVNNATTLNINTNATHQLLCPPTAATATVTPSGGTPPYTYLWSPGSQTNSIATGLGWGTYTVTVTDSAGCSASSPVTISLYYSNLTAFTNETAATCSSNDGSAYIVMYGGKEPYTYAWSPGGMTTDSVTGLSAGTYTVSVTDSNGCSLTASVTIAGNSPTLSLSASLYTITVGDSTLLSATSNTSGTYSWSPASSLSNPNSANTFATPTVTTTYTCTETTGCGTITKTITITVGCGLNANIYSTHFHCDSLPGTAFAIPSSGNPPYTYLWSPGGQTNQTATGLSPGVYYVTVRDSTGCTWTDSIGVSSAAISMTVQAWPASITPGDSSLLEAFIYVPAIITWTPSSSVADPHAANTECSPAVTTTYTCTAVTPCDTIIETVTVTVSGCFSTNVNSTASICGQGNASAWANPSAGNPPYTYLWAPGGQTTQTITGLTYGTYTVTVTDSTGCSVSTPVNVYYAYPSFSASESQDTIFIGGSDTLNGICNPTNVSVTYLWSNGATTSTITVNPVITTTYTVFINTPCSADSLTLTVHVIPFPCTNNYDEPICIVTVDTATDKCEVIWGRTNSPSSGSYNVYKENSSFTYSFLVNQPLNVLSDYLDVTSNPSAGPSSYELATVDSCGVSALSAPHTSIFLMDSAEVGQNVLHWTAYVGFTPVYYYIYRGTNLGNLVKIDSVPYTTLTYTDIAPPPSSVYLIEALNPNGPCVPTTSIRNHADDGGKVSMSNLRHLKNPTAVPTVINSITNLNIYPNPSGGQITISYSLNTDGYVRMNLVDELGQIVYDNTEQKTAGKYDEQVNLESLATGIYTLRMQTGSGTTIRKVVIMHNK
jgi:hypothetical protein